MHLIDMHQIWRHLS